MAKPKPCATKKFQGGAFMEQELAYSFHLGSDKNKSKLAKKVAKENLPGTTSLSNNAIQNAKDLSDVNKHNLRDYDNQRELIRTIYGTDDIACEIIIELGDMDFWNDKDERYRFKMVDVYNEQIQVVKSKLFTKTTLTQIQDKMRNACIKSFNKFYDMDFKLKEKQKGRNQDINVNDMGNYREIKKQQIIELGRLLVS